MFRGVLHAGLAAALLASTLLGCAEYPGAPTARPGATIRFQAGLMGAHYRVRSAITPYTAQDVGQVVLRLFTVEGDSVLPVTVLVDGDPVPLEVPVDNLGTNFEAVALSFSHLAPDTTYRITAEAYAPGDTTRRHPLQVQDGTCQNDVYVGPNDQEVVEDTRHQSPIVVPVTLIDKVVSAEATSPLGVAITGGTLLHAPNDAQN